MRVHNEGVDVDESSTRLLEAKRVTRTRRAMQWALRVANIAAMIAGVWIAEAPGFLIGVALFVAGEIYGPRAIERVVRDRSHVSRR